MSAFICDSTHISALACYATEHGLCGRQLGLTSTGMSDQEHVGRLLHHENARSVAYRYNEPPDDDYSFAFVTTRTVPPVHIIKAARCYQYQACEHPEWEDSRARAITDGIISHATTRIAGYDDAPWGWFAS